MKNIIIFGASGAIGSALIKQYSRQYPDATIHAVARSNHANFAANVRQHTIDYHDETQLKQLQIKVCSAHPLDSIIVATGLLHSETLQPEKSLSQLSAENLQHVFAINTILPTMIAKYFIPSLNKQTSAVFAALSARVGSISDNRLGGWYAYRASKAALNMMIKNCAIETQRKNKNAIIVGLHPGTVDSGLSKPFQSRMPEGQLFTPDFSAKQLLSVISTLHSADSGKCFAWDGKVIPT